MEKNKKFVEYEILLNSTEKVKNYIQDTFSILGDITISSLDNKYKVDGRSVLGVLSLNLSNPLIVTFEYNIESELDDFNKAINKYLN